MLINAKVIKMLIKGEITTEENTPMGVRVLKRQALTGEVALWAAREALKESEIFFGSRQVTRPVRKSEKSSIPPRAQYESIKAGLVTCEG